MPVPLYASTGHGTGSDWPAGGFCVVTRLQIRGMIRFRTMNPEAGIPLSVYIHWPFCASRCPYCDFNSHVRDHTDEDQWARWYARELAWWATQTLPGSRVETVFFGGGTPSLMSARLVGHVLETVHALWPVAPGAEISLEANPGSVEAARFLDFRAAGINRVSLGVQALREEALRFLGRRHSVAEARAAIRVVRDTFDRWSLDLICARPGQTWDTWQPELDEALDLAGGHLSLYQLTIEPGTPFFQHHARGDWVLPGEDDAARIYSQTRRHMADRGFRDYEISNYARPGEECRHNLVYWRGGNVAGSGPGAHSRIQTAQGTEALHMVRTPETWGAQVEAVGHGVRERVLLSVEAYAEERLMMGLRLAEGVNRARFRLQTGHDPVRLVGEERVQVLCNEGLMACSDTVLRATSRGRLCLNALMAWILPLKGFGLQGSLPEQCTAREREQT